MTPSPAVAALRAAEVDYGGARALGPVSLELQAGRVTALVGPSGCGKSTALRLLAGLEAATRGGVERTAAPGRTAVVFQAPTLMPWATARENAALPLRLADAPARRRRARRTASRRSSPAAWPCACRWRAPWRWSRSCS